MDTYVETISTTVSSSQENILKDIMRYLQIFKNDHAGEFWWGVIFGCSFSNWGVNGLLHGNLKLVGRRLS